jgi:SSS family solute:Na+ symporter
MITKILLLSSYFLMVLVLGFIAKSRLKNSPGDYFLAGRGLSGFVLIGTMAATNFSAFTVFGASGAGYRDGMAFFPIMGFGTGFMALSFWLVGRKIWSTGKKYGLITPPELVHQIYGSPVLSALFALVMLLATIPYLALQPIAAGRVFQGLFNMPSYYGALIITLIIMIYTLRGGLKAVAWTDVFQGVLMLICMVIALFLVADHHGGLSASAAKVAKQNSKLLSRPGAMGIYGPGMWFSYIFLWFFCDPMFPQLFQRFYSAKSERGIRLTMLCYPAVCAVVFALPVTLGVLGHLSFPGLSGAETDSIVPKLMTSLGGDFMGTLVLAAGLAALMSTMDSQLLTVSSIFSRDLYPMLSGKKPQTATVGRICVVIMSLAGLGLALFAAGSSILKIALWPFTALAVLFPTVLFGLYLENPRASSALASIIAGELAVLGYIFDLLPKFGLLPAVPVIVVSLGAYLIVQAACGRIRLPEFDRKSLYFLLGFLAVFALGMDFWNWGRMGELWLAWPAWSWYFLLLSAAQTILMIFWAKPGTGLPR